MDRQSRLSVIWEEEEIPLEAMNQQHFEDPANGSRVDLESQATPRKMIFRKIILYVFLVLSGLIAIAGGCLLAVGQTEIGHKLTGQVSLTDNKTQGIIQQASVPEITTTQYLSTVEPINLLPDQANKTKSEGNLRASLFLSFFSHPAFVAMSTGTVPMALVRNQTNHAVQDVELGYLHGPPQLPSMGELRHESDDDGNQVGDLALFVAGLGTIILVIIIFTTILVPSILKIRRRRIECNL